MERAAESGGAVTQVQTLEKIQRGYVCASHDGRFLAYAIGSALSHSTFS